MHVLQKKLLLLSSERNLGSLTLREIGALVGERSPQKIKHHLSQLERRALLKVNRVKGVIQPSRQGWLTGVRGSVRLFSLPVLGSANCGPAEIFAIENIEGYLRVSGSVLKRTQKSNLFALRAEGTSMNRAEVNGKSIEEGDYLIIDSKARTPCNGDVVLVVIDDMATIKIFIRDRENGQVLLMSDSTQQFLPIYLHESDNFSISGKVVDVVKKPHMRWQ